MARDTTEPLTDTDFADLDAITEDVPYTPQLVGHLLHRICSHYQNPEILELACGYGKITPYLASAAESRNGSVRAIDHKYELWEGKSAEDRVEEAELSDVCDFTFGVDARWYILELLLQQPGEWIDVVYLDLSHTIEIDAFVALAVWNHLRPGGVLVFDDLDWKPDEHGSEKIQNQTNRPQVQQMQMLFKYICQQPSVGDHTTWGGEKLNWRWGFIQKAKEEETDDQSLSEIIANF